MTSYKSDFWLIFGFRSVNNDLKSTRKECIDQKTFPDKNYVKHQKTDSRQKSTEKAPKKTLEDA